MSALFRAISTSKSRLLVATTIVGFLVVTTGCTSTLKARDAASPSAPASSSPSVAPVTGSATPTPTPTKPALDTLVVSPQGIDTLLLGSPVTTEPASTAIVAYDDDYCPVWGAVGQPGVGLWLPNYPKASDAFTVRTEGRVKNGIVTSLRVWSPEITTEAGIHIDSTLAEVKAAYPQPSYLIHAALTDIYVIDGGPAEWISRSDERRAASSPRPTSARSSI